MDVLIYQSSVGWGYVGGADEASSALAYRFRVWSGQSAFTVTASNLDPSPLWCECGLFNNITSEALPMRIRLMHTADPSLSSLQVPAPIDTLHHELADFKVTYTENKQHFIDDCRELAWVQSNGLTLAYFNG
ncbi:hypothetical protein DER46DRAFT_567540 [Fusarium sp. MPI-SDFR-AT-0072]|nr:hypothetical protein DER46DRAFT_567540 [Fusarium sp. MPI-SDFR-AT-0072]